MKKRLIYILIYILIMFVYYFFIYDFRCSDLSVTAYYVYKILHYFIWFFPIIMIFFFSREYLGYNLFVCMITHFIICTLISKKINANLTEERPSMVIPTVIINKKNFTSRHFKSQKVWLKGTGSIYNNTYEMICGSLGRVGSAVYMRFSVECSLGDTLLYLLATDTNRKRIYDFAFYEGEDFYTYHDYSLRKPDLVYYKAGFNVLYNAVCDTSAIADSTVLLSFKDVVGKDQIVKYSVKGYHTIPDTFLIYRNVNEKLDTKWHVCAPEINTPENRAKISDYGYIFHYDICSKQEIESQCPQIKNYVEKYKERNK